MKIIDPNIAYYVYCRDQQGQIELLDIQAGAAVFHDVTEDVAVASSLRKGAFLSALLLTMSHAMEKGEKPVDVAKAFFDASSIHEIVPELQAHNDGAVYAQALSEKAKANAGSQAVMNLMLLMRIAHHGLAHGVFVQKEKLKTDFGQALKDNQWPLEFSETMDAVFDMDLSAGNDDDIDNMLGDAQHAHDNQIALFENAYGDLSVLALDEYRLLS